MGDLDEFAAECRHAARGLRRLPKDLRRDVAREVKDRIAEPLAGHVGRAFVGPYARVLQAATKARAQADPQIVVGGARPRLRNGATPRDLVFGNEYGGGRKVAVIPRGNGHKGYRRLSTMQFVPARPSIMETVADHTPEALDEFADIVLERLEEAVDRG